MPPRQSVHSILSFRHFWVSFLVFLHSNRVHIPTAACVVYVGKRAAIWVQPCHRCRRSRSRRYSCRSKCSSGRSKPKHAVGCFHGRDCCCVGREEANEPPLDPPFCAAKTRSSCCKKEEVGRGSRRRVMLKVASSQCHRPKHQAQVQALR